MATRSKSGDPRKRVPAYESNTSQSSGPTAADQWVSKVGEGTEDVRLPSGNVARVRRAGPEAFLTQGLMPDTITPIVEKAIRSKKGLKPTQQVDMAKDPKQVGALLEMLDRTLVYAVVEPRVQMPPGCLVCGELDTLSVKAHNDETDEHYHKFDPEDRQPGILYADRVDLEDKMFVMNFVVGGTRDLERFRRELRAGMAGLSAGEGN